MMQAVSRLDKGFLPTLVDIAEGLWVAVDLNRGCKIWL